MTSDRPAPRVGIACQGGGTHTAFVAGALAQLLRANNHEVVALSGTAVGSICALLAWYGLSTNGPDEAARLVEGFWNSAASTTLPDWLAGEQLGLTKVHDVLAIPEWSPNEYPEMARASLTEELRRWVDFDEMARLPEPGPLLIIGAVDVREGTFSSFSSRRGEINQDAVLASNAFLQAVTLNDSIYLDGSFTQNPPIRGLLQAHPDEIWVIRVNKIRRVQEPRTTTEIIHRRNELAGALSMEQELSFVRSVNEWLEQGLLDYASWARRIVIRLIDLDLDLDLHTRLDFSSAFVSALLAHGRDVANRFMADLAFEEHRG